MKNILVIGTGRFGSYVIKKFSDLGDEILAIDKREENLTKILPFVTSSLVGDTTDADFMNSVGVNNFDICIVAIGDNFQNSLETTSLLKELGAKFVISRASRDVHEKFLLRNGADKVVYPEKNMAEWTAIRYSASTIRDYIPVPGDYSIFEVDVPDSWVGKSIIDLKIRQKMHLNILAVTDEGKFNMEYDPAEPFKAGETVMVIGKDSDLRKHLGLNY